MKIEKHVCPECNGKGVTPFLNRPNRVNKRKTCLTCYGVGKVWPYVITDWEMAKMARKLKTKPAPGVRSRSVFR